MNLHVNMIFSLKWLRVAAAYLAIRPLHQLTDDAGAQFPAAANLLKSEFYVDDLLTGADTLAEAALIRDQLIQLTSQGGFELRQWASNDPSLTQSVASSSEGQFMTIAPDKFTKTLGLRWDRVLDTFGYTVRDHEPLQHVTKRGILSRVAQLFDPLGLLGPIIVRAKLIMQELWKLKISWDETLPETLHTEWRRFESQLNIIATVSIYRRIICSQQIELELHGFCDASERAYGACLYMRSKDISGHYSSQLICSKSRVAPLKVQSLPRLELCAAVLLVKLFNATIKSLKSPPARKILWTDSMIVLHWIRTPPHALKVFVANRVSDIQSVHEAQWRHVPTLDNPADCLSRGVEPREFNPNNSWLCGPQWLRQSEDGWPCSALLPAEVPERRAVVSLTTPLAPTSCLLTNPLSVDEVRVARQRILRFVQSSEFAKDISLLSKARSYNGKLRTLNPFIDDDGILRVGGRITHAITAHDKRHPVILPVKHHLTTLIIRQKHPRHNHTGVTGTLNAVRQMYWPINGTRTVKTYLRTCVSCHRAHLKAFDYQMGNLPKDRVTPSRPFLKTGIDYCWPFLIKEKRLRNTKTIKAYVAVFVCFATKAVHLELVGDLTTSAFLAALKRFFARRGRSSDIYSDNAKNFVGANRELRDVHESFKTSIADRCTQHYALSHNVVWYFIPPRAPNFGRLWEAAVKAVKRHLIRVYGRTLLTYEAMITYLAEVEAILNSRSLIPLSSDPNDLTALTPGHFLIATRLTLWQHVQQMREHFWARWHKDYLHELTVRRKWHTQAPQEVKEGKLVIVHEDNVPPLYWALGRIVALHPGDDNITRVVTVTTINGEYKRSVKRLSPSQKNMFNHKTQESHPYTCTPPDLLTSIEPYRFMAGLVRVPSMSSAHVLSTVN
ncbi:uncharacterized protein LOC143145582 [Ptiloglossa arizonensis]|uniref:uncharacterized protein LOC143145582 n=1 Tax=Ptiloglossa arizonensis TaxID=3350558 RepID=UPI003FA0DA64